MNIVGGPGARRGGRHQRGRNNRLDATLLRQVEALLSEPAAFCLATIVDGRGSIPQIVGARALFTGDGLVYGTVGGGRLEELCKETAAGLLAGDQCVRNRFERLNLARDVGMTCAGEVSVFFEVHRPDLQWDVVVFGAGHVAQKLCRFLIELDCRVACIDNRPEWLARLPRCENLEIVQVASHAHGVDRIKPHSMVIVMTMGHATDVPILQAIASARSRVPFIGVIGSKSKAQILKRELLRGGLAADFVDSIVCPVGEKLGNNTPGEIAVGIVSQLVRVREATRAQPG